MSKWSDEAERVSGILSARAQRLEQQSIDALAYAFILDGAPVDDMSSEQALKKLKAIMDQNGIKESG